MEILAFLMTFLVGYLADSLIGIRMNWPDCGAIAAIAFSGSIILWAVRHQKPLGTPDKPDEDTGE